MPSARGNTNSDSCNAYLQQKLANIERNKRRLEALNIPVAHQSRPKKTSKKIHSTSNATTEPHNLRPRTQRNNAQLEEEQLLGDTEAAGDFLGDNEDLQIGSRNNNIEKRKGRGVTRKDDIFSRTPDMPKLIVLLNDRGQPVGKDARQLASVIGCQVRKKLSVGCEDWRLVDAEKKYELWTDMKTFYDLHDGAFNWVMHTAGKKWKEFKAALKALYFNPELTNEEVGESKDKRVNDTDWKFLFTYWRSAECQARTEIAKANRAKLQLLHNSGSVSFACSEHDLAVKLGRPPRRDETFIKTHTRKNGVPSSQAEPIINQLKEVVEAHPDLKDKSIQQGDAFAAVYGEKEPKGYVRVLGPGPTPQEIGTPGLKCYTPTRLQMEVLAHKKAENEKAALEQRLDQLQARMDVLERMGQQDRASVEPMSQHGSTSRHDVHEDPDDEDYASGDNALHDENVHNLVAQVDGAAPSRPARNITTTPRSIAAPRSEHDALVGKEVILYAMLRSDQPVAKGTVVSTNPSTLLAGQCLGRQFCEVIVTVVLKRDAVVPRPYVDMETMADAHMMSLAWPYKRLKICNNASTQSTSGRC